MRGATVSGGSLTRRGARGCCRSARSTRCWPSTASGSSVTRTSPSAIRRARGVRRSRRACSRRCCCWPIATGSPTSARWRRCGLICAGRSRWICPVDHPGFHPTSLVKFRARLLLHGKERVVFERSIELATELGLLEGDVEQIVDSTPMLGAAAIQDTVHLVRAGVRKLLDAVKAADAPAAGSCARASSLTTRARVRSRPETGTTSRPARRCWSRSPPTRSARCERSRTIAARGRGGGRRGRAVVGRDRRPGVRHHRRRGRSAAAARPPDAADHLRA